MATIWVINLAAGDPDEAVLEAQRSARYLLGQRHEKPSHTHIWQWVNDECEILESEEMTWDDLEDLAYATFDDAKEQLGIF